MPDTLHWLRLASSDVGQIAQFSFTFGAQMLYSTSRPTFQVVTTSYDTMRQKSLTWTQTPVPGEDSGLEERICDRDDEF